MIARVPLNARIYRDPEFEKTVEKNLDIDFKLISSNLSISTLTTEVKTPVKFNSENISLYMPITTERQIKQNNEGIINIKSKKNSKNFLNTITLTIKIQGKKAPIGLKVFARDSLHITGCQNVNNIFDVLELFFNECIKEKAVMVEGEKKHIIFVKNPECLDLTKLYDFKINMINANFTVPFKIDRPKLFNLLKLNNVFAEYDSNRHAGVKIRYVKVEKKITIFVFESGSIIIILGNQGFGKINQTYNFITTFLLTHYDIINKSDETDRINQILSINKYIDDHNL